MKEKDFPGNAYGYCPKCGSIGVSRERGLNGNDKCASGHEYPSFKAVPVSEDREENLKPCPFCGGKAYYGHKACGPEAADQTKWLVNCQTCTVSTSVPMHTKGRKLMQTYILGPRGMVPALNGSGDWIKIDEHNKEVADWELSSNKNRQLAEKLLGQQDDEIATKNIRLQNLESNIKKLSTEIAAKNDIIEDLNKELVELTGAG